MTGAGRIGATSSGQAPTLRIVAVAALAMLAAACSTTSPYRPPPHRPYPTPHRPPVEAPRPTPRVEPVPEPPRTDLIRLTELPGWEDDDHAEALAAFQAGCVASHQRDMTYACQAARALTTRDEATARRFFERHFRAQRMYGEGVLTGYFAPIYQARHNRGGPYTAPVRPPPGPDVYVAGPMTTATYAPPTPPTQPPAPAVAATTTPPADLANLIAETTGSDPVSTAPPPKRDPVSELLGRDDPQLVSPPPAPRPDSIAAVLQSPPPAPQPSRIRMSEAERALIDGAAAPDAIAWMRPEDLFFMQIQGSGLLVFEDGRRLRAAYAGDNGKPFVGIARTMVRDGQLPSNGASGDGIRAWLSAHAGPMADAVMWKNPRYVFFRLKQDDGREPSGAAGVPLPPGRAIALDSSRHTYGELYWLDAEAPLLAGAAKRYRRLAVALDTGGAIRGEIRADLYFGTGEAAGREAGRVRHVLHMARLTPVDPDTAEAGDATSVTLGGR